MLVLEFSTGDVNVERLTECQCDGSAGLYAEALTGFLQWLAPRYQGIRDGLRAEMAELREKALAGTVHRRTPEIIANLYIGLRYFLAFAEEADAITAAEKADLLHGAWEALGEAAASQAEHVRDADPARQFLRLLSGAIASGRAHMARTDGSAPDNAKAWGWCQDASGNDQNPDEKWRPQGRCIGWISGQAVLLEPEAAFAEAQALASIQGNALTVSKQTMWKRLRERGLLANTDQSRQTNTVRCTIAGVRREVISLRLGVLDLCNEPDQSDQTTQQSEKSGQAPRQVGGSVNVDPTTNSTEKTTENNDLVGLVGSAMQEDGMPEDRSSRVVCAYPHHRQRWRSIHGVILCGICAKPTNKDIVAEWIDEPPSEWNIHCA